jgi:hypothetical protein
MNIRIKINTASRHTDSIVLALFSLDAHGFTTTRFISDDNRWQIEASKTVEVDPWQNAGEEQERALAAVAHLDPELLSYDFDATVCCVE